ncbi:unnamed protein product [Amoebophrya sp. A120]|nr:unnamed protein product [Amoebophrya sp. A120]|eukprot:GSA120T00023797001.1
MLRATLQKIEGAWAALRRGPRERRLTGEDERSEDSDYGSATESGDESDQTGSKVDSEDQFETGPVGAEIENTAGSMLSESGDGGEDGPEPESGSGSKNGEAKIAAIAARRDEAETSGRLAVERLKWGPSPIAANKRTSLKVIAGWATLRRKMILDNNAANTAGSAGEDEATGYPVDFTNASGELLLRGFTGPNAVTEEYKREFLHRATRGSLQPLPQECYDMLNSPEHSPLPHVDSSTNVPNTSTGAPLRYRVMCRFFVTPNPERHVFDERQRLIKEALEALNLDERYAEDIRALRRSCTGRVGHLYEKAFGCDVPELLASWMGGRDYEWGRDDLLLEKMENEWDCRAMKKREFKNTLEVRFYSSGELLAFLDDVLLGNALHFHTTEIEYDPLVEYEIQKHWREWTFSLIDWPPAPEQIRLLANDIDRYETLPNYCPAAACTEANWLLYLDSKAEALLRCQFVASLPVAQRLWTVLTCEEMVPIRQWSSPGEDGAIEQCTAVPLSPARTAEEKKRTHNLLRHLCDTYSTFNTVRYALEDNSEMLIFEPSRSGAAEDVEGDAEADSAEVLVLIPDNGLPINNWAYLVPGAA